MSASRHALQTRLIRFGTAVCVGCRRLPADGIGLHLRDQLVRTSTSTAASHAAASHAQSAREEAYHLRRCVNGLREAMAWMQFAGQVCPFDAPPARLLRECHDLIALVGGHIPAPTSTHPPP